MTSSLVRARALLVTLLLMLMAAAPAAHAALPGDSFTSFFNLADPFSGPNEIAAGPDGNLWFTDEGSADRIGRITPSGASTEFPLTTGSDPYGIAAGPDGNLWFAEKGTDKIGRITPAGAITEFPLAAGSHPWGIAAGPDGNLWFTANGTNKIGRITTSGVITQWTIPTASSQPRGITLGPDGQTMWFTESGASKIGFFHLTDPSTILENNVTPTTTLTGITAGPDGFVYFAETSAGQLGRIAPSGFIENIGSGSASQAWDVATGPDGRIWITSAAGGPVARYNPATGFEVGMQQVGIEIRGIATGPDGNVWNVDHQNATVRRYGTGVQDASIDPPLVAGSGEQGTAQSCTGDRWTSWAGVQPVTRATWSRDGAPIGGAAARSYVPTQADVGHQLTCTITARYPVLLVSNSATSPGISVRAPGSGPQGPTGATGATGPQGPAGRPGRDAKVTCKVVGKKTKKPKVVCKVQRVKSASKTARWRLARSGRTVARGSTRLRGGRLTVGVPRSARVASGRYTLTIVAGPVVVRRVVRIR